MLEISCKGPSFLKCSVYPFSNPAHPLYHKTEKQNQYTFPIFSNKYRQDSAG